MCLTPGESYRFPDLQEGAVSKQRLPEPSAEDALEPETSADTPPELISEGVPIFDKTERVPDLADPIQAENPSPIPPRPTPVMPLIPVVPDQLSAGFESAIGDTEPETEPIGMEEVDVGESSGSGEQHRSARRRRRQKLIRFILFEGIAICAVLVFAKLEVNERFSGNSLTYLYGTIMLISALAAAIIPVIFYALPPTLPPGRQ